MHVGVLKEALLVGILALLGAGQTGVWGEAGGLAVEWWQASVDTAGQSGVSGLAGE